MERWWGITSQDAGTDDNPLPFTKSSVRGAAATTVLVKILQCCRLIVFFSSFSRLMRFGRLVEVVNYLGCDHVWSQPENLIPGLKNWYLPYNFAVKENRSLLLHFNNKKCISIQSFWRTIWKTASRSIYMWAFLEIVLRAVFTYLAITWAKFFLVKLFRFL
jgi:hypothetical protein